MQWGKYDADTVWDAKFDVAAEMAGVSPMMPRVLWDAIWGRAVKNGSGSFEGFIPKMFAVKFKVGLEEIARVLTAFAELGMVVGDRLANWAKRQGEGVIRAAAAVAQPASKALSESLTRVRHHRQKRADANRQMSLLLPIAANDAPERSAPVHDVTPVTAVTAVSPQSENDNQPKPLNDNALEKRREDKDSFFTKMKVVRGGRYAPLEAPDGAWLKQHKREALQQKLFRFAVATMTPERYAAACCGLMAEDPAEAQRWLDRLDLEMRAAGWDDKREAADG